jgi:hypothetical protein
VLTAAERSEGKRQAELWLGRGVSAAAPGPGAPSEQTATAAVPKTVLPAEGDKPSPPSAVAAVAPLPPRVPSLADAEKALAEAMRSMRCAALRQTTNDHGRLVIAGTVPDESEKARLLRVIADFAPEYRPELRVRLVPPPLCQSLASFASLRAASIVADAPPARLAGSGATLREGDPIRIEVEAGKYPVNLRIDYFSLDGRVMHMLPNERTPAVTLPAGGKRVFGSGEDWRAGGAPFGTELILVVATPKPLNLGERPLIEDAATYLPALERELRRSAVAAEPNLLATLLVETSAR